MAADDEGDLDPMAADRQPAKDAHGSTAGKRRGSEVPPDADDDDEGTPAGAGSDEGDGDDDEWTPPTKEEWEEAQKKLTTANEAINKANQDAGRNRKRYFDLKKQMEGKAPTGAAPKPSPPAAPKTEAGAEADGAGADSTIAQHVAEAERYKTAAIRSSAKASLLAAGFQHDADKPDRLTRLLRMVDTAEVEVDDDGQFYGIDDQVEELKDQYPELFTPPAAPEPESKPAPKPKPPKYNGAGRPSGDAPAAPKSAGERHAAMIGRGR